MLALCSWVQSYAYYNSKLLSFQPNKILLQDGAPPHWKSTEWDSLDETFPLHIESADKFVPQGLPTLHHMTFWKGYFWRIESTAKCVEHSRTETKDIRCIYSHYRQNKQENIVLHRLGILCTNNGAHVELQQCDHW